MKEDEFKIDARKLTEFLQEKMTFETYPNDEMGLRFKIIYKVNTNEMLEFILKNLESYSIDKDVDTAQV